MGSAAASRSSPRSRRGVPCDAGGPRRCLCAAARGRGPGRIDPPGCAGPGIPLGQRPSRQAFQRRRHHRLGQILRGIDDPALGHRAEPAWPRHAARPALRIRARLSQRSDRAEPRRRPASSLLAVQFRGAGRDRLHLEPAVRAVQDSRRGGARREDRLLRQALPRPPYQYRHPDAVSRFGPDPPPRQRDGRAQPAGQRRRLSAGQVSHQRRCSTTRVTASCSAPA